MDTTWLNPVHLVSLNSENTFIFFALVKIKATDYQDASSMIGYINIAYVQRIQRETEVTIYCHTTKL